MKTINLESLVPSLDLCRELKAAGFPQDTALAYYDKEVCRNAGIARTWGLPSGVCIVKDMGEEWPLLCFAPTAEEILTALPQTILKKQIYVLEAQRRGDVLDVWETDWYFNGLQLAASTTDTISGSLAESAALAYLWWRAQP